VQRTKLESEITKRIKAANFESPLELLFRSSENIARASGWPLDYTNNLITQVANFHNIHTLNQLSSSKQSRVSTPIPSFSNAINRLLGGGFFSQRIYEIYGEYRSGKTQLCHVLAVSFQDPSIETEWRDILYIDTENTFRPERILEIIAARRLTPKNSLESITVVKIPNFSSQQLFFRKLYETVRDRHVGLVIIDSFTNHFRKEIAESFERYSLLKNVLIEEFNTLVQIRDSFPTCIILTNQVRSEFDTTADRKVRPVAEAILGTYASEIFFLRVTEEEKHFFRVVRSLFGPEGEVEFKLGPAGLIDP
jgi:DNA repair protein RadA